MHLHCSGHMDMLDGSIRADWPERTYWSHGSKRASGSRWSGRAEWAIWPERTIRTKRTVWPERGRVH